jgi:hypothetical protein|tara:strand:+ start:246 stop:512 length:267 start_codon:yes stop_codon:yes gene_type:complete
MSYFNEPTRLAMLKLMPEVKKMFDEPPKDTKPTGKGLLSRSVTSSGVGVRQAMGVTEIEKVRNYMVNIRREMGKYKAQQIERKEEDVI